MRRLPLILAIVAFFAAHAFAHGGDFGLAVLAIGVCATSAGVWIGMQMPKPREREPPHKPIRRSS